MGGGIVRLNIKNLSIVYIINTNTRIIKFNCKRKKPKIWFIFSCINNNHFEKNTNILIIK
eukprot:UN09741